MVRGRGGCIYQCNNKNNIYQLFYFFYVIYFTHSSSCCFYACFPFLENYTFGCRKGIFSDSFWPRRLKQTSFCRELIAYAAKLSKKYFPPVSRKKNTKLWTIVKKCKILKKTFKNIFLHFIFFKLKKNESFAHAPSLCEWNKIINFIISVKL